MAEESRLSNLESEIIRSESSPSESAFSDEPFACPNCGQMLAPTCRVCVACKHTIHLTEIRRPRAAVTPLESQVGLPPVEPARFSWQIFFLVLAVWFLAAIAAQGLLGPAKTQLVLGSVVIVSSAWVFFDAQAKSVPKPLRWGLGSLLLWIVVFPWYLTRRRTPEAPCPFVEAEVGPFARVLFFALVVFFLLGIVAMILKGPPPK